MWACAHSQIKRCKVISYTHTQAHTNILPHSQPSLHYLGNYCLRLFTSAVCVVVLGRDELKSPIGQFGRGRQGLEGWGGQTLDFPTGFCYKLAHVSPDRLQQGKGLLAGQTERNAQCFQSLTVRHIRDNSRCINGSRIQRPLTENAMAHVKNWTYSMSLDWRG